MNLLDKIKKVKRDIKDTFVEYEETIGYMDALKSLLHDFKDTHEIKHFLGCATRVIRENCHSFHYRHNIEEWKDYESKYYCFLFANENYKSEYQQKLWAILIFGQFYYKRRKDELYPLRNALANYANELVDDILKNENNYPETYMTYFKVKMGIISEYI